MVDRHGPTGIYGWQVKIDTVELQGVTRVVIPAISTESGSGTSEDAWGDTTYQDLEMEISSVDGGGSVIADWQEEISTNDPNGLKDVEIALINQDGTLLGKYLFDDCWLKYYGPVEYNVADDSPYFASEVITVDFDSMEWEDA